MYVCVIVCDDMYVCVIPTITWSCGDVCVGMYTCMNTCVCMLGGLSDVLRFSFSFSPLKACGTVHGGGGVVLLLHYL
jgi:hypothetical protein